MPTPAILSAGLPASLGIWLANALDDVSVQAVETGDELLAQLNVRNWSLLIIDETVNNPALAAPLRRLRGSAQPAQVVYCSRFSPQDPRLTDDAIDQLGATQVLFHPLDRDELVHQVARLLHVNLRAKSAGENEQQKTKMAVAQVWERYKNVIFKRIEAIESSITNLLENKLEPAGRQEAEREAHKLAGSLGTFGHSKGSQLAKEIETIFQGAEPLGQSETRRLAEAIVALRNELQRAGDVPSLPDQSVFGERGHAPMLMIVDDDNDLGGRLAMEAEKRGIRTCIFTTPQAARKNYLACAPDIVLVGLQTAQESTDGLASLAELTSLNPAIPAFVLAEQHSFTDRLEAARLGGRGFLWRQMPPATILEALASTLDRLRATQSKVLAVDDDPQMLAMLESLLTSRGMQLTGVCDPRRFWNALENENPDLILLDVDMPYVSGIELCRVIRADPRWNKIPVIFLTARTDGDTVHRVFAAGADDFVSKPVVEPELLTRVTNRLERSQLLRQMAETDPLTGLSNRARSMQLLKQLVSFAGKYAQPLCVAALEIDGFKLLSDRLGYDFGDVVLRRLAQLLAASLCGEDVVGRFATSEFVIGMYGLSQQDSVHRMAELLERLRQEKFCNASTYSIHAAFSAGVAEFPVDGETVDALLQKACEAKNDAKNAGGNRVSPVARRSDQVTTADKTDITIVDDDDALAELLLQSLATRGYHTMRFRDGPAAVEALTGAHPKLRSSLVLLDVNLPGLDGLSVLRRLALDGIVKRTRVIMLTARSLESEIVSALEIGAFDHVAKPFSLPVLMQRIRRALHA